MKNMNLANRYARALYNLAKESNEQDAVFTQMRVVDEAFSLDKQIEDFIQSPLFRPTDKVKALEKVVGGLALSPTLKNFLLLLARKNRLGILPNVLTAFQTIADEAHGVTRGVVRSAAI